MALIFQWQPQYGGGEWDFLCGAHSIGKMIYLTFTAARGSSESPKQTHN